MNQPTPTVSRQDVERVVRRDFPADAFFDVIAILDEYGTESHHRERNRVQLGVLKVADGSKEEVRCGIEVAKVDFRDVLSLSEFPGYSKVMFQIGKLPEEEQKKIVEGDWKQYNDWLTR